MPKKKVPVKYTSRDFASIKEDLIDHAKRYYADTYKDFSEASFGSLMLDTVAYVGDILSFYLDYQANESFLHTAVEYDNVIKLSKQLGYKFKGPPSSHGIATFYVLVPANSSGNGPDTAYMPILLKGSEFSSVDGNNFILTENTHFSDSNNEIVVGRVNTTTGLPTYFAVKAHGRVISGRMVQDAIDIGEYQRFRRIKLAGENIAEVVTVVDSDGHEYFEVPYLSQNVVWKELYNTGANVESARSILKPVVVPRRFIVEQERDQTFLQFGYGSVDEISTSSVAEPNRVVLNMHGKDHIVDEFLDPSKLIATDKFGVAPSNTTMYAVYRQNTTDSVNVSVESLTNVANPRFKFLDVGNLDASIVQFVIGSLEVTNESPITGDVSIPSAEELKRRAMDEFATQNRAVTRQDYISTTYSMPPQFGAVKRCNIVQDTDSFKRNLNMYLISENADGTLVATVTIIKENLKVWLNKNRMIHDTIDILDARIVNLGIEFTAIASSNVNKFDALNAGTIAIKEAFEITADIGEPFYITDVHKALRNVSSIIDVVDVKITNKNGGIYSDSELNIDNSMSPDGRFITVPEDVIWEIKIPNTDIKGTIK